MSANEDNRVQQRVERYLTFARHALGRRHLEEAAGHYDYVRQLAPDNMEAIFYSAYCRTADALGKRDYERREACFAELLEAIRGVEAAYPTTVEDKASVLTRIDARMRGLADLPFAYEKEGVGGVAWERERIDAAEAEFVRMLIRLADAQNDPLPRRLAEGKGEPLNIQKRQIAREKRHRHNVAVGLSLGAAFGVLGGAVFLLGTLYFGGQEFLPLGVMGAAVLLIAAPFLGWTLYR